MVRARARIAGAGVPVRADTHRVDVVGRRDRWEGAAPGTWRTMRPSATLATLAAAGLLAAATGCADDTDEADEPEVEVSEDPDEVLTDEEQEAMDDIDPESGQDDVIEEKSGVGIGVLPSCAEPGDQVTITVEGLEADAEHVLRIDPELAPPEVLEPSVPARSDDAGEIELDLAVPEEDVDTGDYTLEVLATEQGQAQGDPLIDGPLEIAETCTTT